MEGGTRIVKVDVSRELGRFESTPGGERLGKWQVAPDSDPDTRESMSALRDAATYLRTKDIPVAFPTETVYGLAADATRSAAVKGIYAAKGRPSDNPLIIHVSDLEMLRQLLRPASTGEQQQQTNGQGQTDQQEQEQEQAQANDTTPAATLPTPAQVSPSLDAIPQIYAPLIERFWPGPLTILLPNPSPSHLAPEVTAGLPTFGVRMPSSPLALSLIALAGAPLAAPSANASTKPSPTAAGHVRDDLDGRIELILDGGPCAVGVESTVVDGLCDPPVVLRPGGVSLEELRRCEGWGSAVRAYKDASIEGGGGAGKAPAPRAPGMKYKHYSPKARVVLYEASGGSGGGAGPDVVKEDDLQQALSVPVRDQGADRVANGEQKGERRRRIGVIRTKRWKSTAGLASGRVRLRAPERVVSESNGVGGEEGALLFKIREGELLEGQGGDVGAEKEQQPLATMFDIDLGADIGGIAQGLFSALRELDRRGADVIFVDGIAAGDDIAAAVMNRLRKAASEVRS